MQRLHGRQRSQQLAASQDLHRPRRTPSVAKACCKWHRGPFSAGHAPSRALGTRTRASVHLRPEENAQDQPQAQQQPTQCPVNASRKLAQHAAAMAAALAVSVTALGPPALPAAAEMQLSGSGAAAALSAQRTVGPAACHSSTTGADVGMLARETVDSTARRLSRFQLRQIDVLHDSTAQVILT